MILNGGKLGNVRVLSPKSIELMTHDQLGKISLEQGFGLGFGVDGIKSPFEELGTLGQYGWGGFFYTEFSVDPKEDLIHGPASPRGRFAVEPPSPRTGLSGHHKLT
jgi:CubicO group peptidase (beta-lactamase class C family)